MQGDLCWCLSADSMTLSSHLFLGCGYVLRSEIRDPHVPFQWGFKGKQKQTTHSFHEPKVFQVVGPVAPESPAGSFDYLISWGVAWRLEMYSFSTSKS